MRFTNWKFHTLLVHHITLGAYKKILPRFISGTVVDVGCGIKPYTFLISPLSRRYLGIDMGGAGSVSGPDVKASAYHTPLKNAMADSVFSSAVMEHLEDPEMALREIFRILKPGGGLVLGVPLFWPLHEKPRDFYRYTEFGISHLLEKTGFHVLEITPLSGFWVTQGALAARYLAGFNRGPLKLTLVVPTACLAIQVMAWCFSFLDRRSTDYTWAYIACARKSPETRENTQA